MQMLTGLNDQTDFLLRGWVLKFLIVLDSDVSWLLYNKEGTDGFAF